MCGVVIKLASQHMDLYAHGAAQCQQRILSFEHFVCNVTSANHSIKVHHVCESFPCQTYIHTLGL